MFFVRYEHGGTLSYLSGNLIHVLGQAQLLSFQIFIYVILLIGLLFYHLHCVDCHIVNFRFDCTYLISFFLSHFYHLILI